MEDQELRVLKELMEELQEEMKPSASDFEERLGRKKPDIEVLKIEADPMGEEPMGHEGDHEDLEMADSESPEERLKQRLMKLRGR